MCKPTRIHTPCTPHTLGTSPFQFLIRSLNARVLCIFAATIDAFVPEVCSLVWGGSRAYSSRSLLTVPISVIVRSQVFFFTNLLSSFDSHLYRLELASTPLLLCQFSNSVGLSLLVSDHILSGNMFEAENNPFSTCCRVV